MATEDELDEFYETLHINKILKEFESLGKVDGPIEAGRRMGMDFEIIEVLVDKGLGSRLEKAIASVGRNVATALQKDPAFLARVAKRVAAESVRVDRERTIHEIKAARALRKRQAGKILSRITSDEVSAEFPVRARWARERMTERGWKATIPSKTGTYGPSAKTVRKILDGKYVTQSTLETFVTALNSSSLPRVSLADVPSN